MGKRIGRQLAQVNSRRPYNKQFKLLHTVGVSVGAFAADACINEFKAESERLNKLKNLRSDTSDTIKEQVTKSKLTLLDPFCSKGIFQSWYGNCNFGKSSDFCEQYLNTDDVVPFTNEPLKYCYCYDVTASDDRKMFIPLPGDNMHSWPGKSNIYIYIIFYLYLFMIYLFNSCILR